VEELEGKVAVVTGGASGIGLAMAHRFAAEGMHLLLADIEEGALDDAAEALHAAHEGITVRTSVTDVSDGEAMDALAADARDSFGTVHVVCNNAGVGSGGQLHTLTTRDWEWCLGVNLWGVIHGIRVFLPMLLEQGEGHVVNTASMAGLIAGPYMGPYNASKFAVVAISETLFQELRMNGSDVGVSVLCPSWVNTKIHDSARNRPDELRNPGADDLAAGGALSEMLRGVIEAGLPPEEVAEQVLAAVRSKHFYILTHDGSEVAVSARAEAIVGNEPPPFFMPQ
jgi:NAD(P)-dependent dehydrogenase (short-subunit alcohol dehydrogenase family)